ncbi:MAG: 4-(cytidine 5'-diphospho)-2-C-methyl-D-erythritol kinase [Proteobacteria bacterium]|nr:4-(cytidine 5'-diphospho)-2-C-methyl-D-erythritol kinase [Pseudomonadota bacterium]
MSCKSLSVFAPAKLNLFLHVTGKRIDGHHTLQSLVVFVDVGDHLTLSQQDGLEINVNGSFAATLINGEDNLVYKAAMLLAQHYQVLPHAKIILTKNLPVASGIGGGSSDAAAALQGLAQLWGFPEEPDILLALAAKLGADVPACVYKTPLWVEGTGDQITLLPDMPDQHFVLVNPLVPTPTPKVFASFQRRFSDPVPLSGHITDVATYRNDLTEAAITVTPVIRDVLGALAATDECLFHRLSGSGATCFGLYSGAEAASRAVRQLRIDYPDWWIVEAGLLK